MNWADVAKWVGMAIPLFSGGWVALKLTSYRGGPAYVLDSHIGRICVAWLEGCCLVGGAFAFWLSHNIPGAGWLYGLLVGVVTSLPVWCALSRVEKDEYTWRDAVRWSHFWRVSVGGVRYYGCFHASGFQSVVDRMGLSHYYTGFAIRHILIPLGRHSTKTVKVRLAATAEASLQEWRDLIRGKEEACGYVLTEHSRADADWETANEAVHGLSTTKITVAPLQASW